jgi:hypothetical protein
MTRVIVCHEDSCPALCQNPCLKVRDRTSDEKAADPSGNEWRWSDGAPIHDDHACAPCRGEAWLKAHEELVEASSFCADLKGSVKEWMDAVRRLRAALQRCREAGE